MTVSLWLFGVQVLAFSIGPTAEAETEGGELAGGTTSAMPRGFVPRMEIPDDCAGLDRNNGWGDEGN